ncbi:MAG TPA: non-homologous end-joining DNA ligase [Pyrinomonadaceae bacterium]|nr:non-homologous end-joining DNA ligase [Pyrinomonadaceae bacterium]
MPKRELEKIPGARKAALPQFIAPQLATLVKEPPAGSQWLHELKFDGYRMLCRIDRGNVQFWSRNGKDWTEKFAGIAEAVKSLSVTSAILDGEIVVVDAQGRSSFQKLQRAMGKSVKTGFVFEVFDLVYLDGFILTRTPLRERKSLLMEVTKGSASRGLVRFSEHFEGDGDAFFTHACEYGIEGIVSKLEDSPYESTRNRNWLKVKCNKQQEFVIAGYTPSSKNLPGFGSLVLGVYETGKLVYAGRVGTGFTFKQRSELQKHLDRFSRATTPLSAIPKDPGLREVRWTDPKLIAEVTFAEWTSDGSIRHPSFQGLRQDKKATEVVRELPADESGMRKGRRS